MEGLRPDRDEQDRFKNRKMKASGSSDASRPKSSAMIEPKKTKGVSAFMVLLLVLLVCASSVLALVYIRQQEQLVLLKEDLNDATGFIGQSKLLLARLEGELSETGDELEKSGSAAKSKLAFLDSEMRKLWGISNDRNKKMIQNNAGAVAGLEARIVDLISSQRENAAASELKYAKLLKSSDQLREVTKQLDSRVSVVAGEAVITRVALEEDLSTLERGLKGIHKLSSVADENKKAIASIDTSRRQINERVVELERKLNAVQLQLNRAK